MKTLITVLFLLIINFTWAQSFFPTVSGGCTADSPVELGTRFTTSANAQITGLRFFKCNSGTQVYTLKLYSGSTLLTSANYTGTSVGWVTVSISPVQVIPGVNYTVSYYSPGGFYQAANPFGWPVKNGTLTATQGVYKYGGGFPNLTYQTSNYFADVVVQSSVPPTSGRDTIYLRDTVVLPCYPPDSSLIVTNGNTIEKYYYFFKDRVVHDTVSIHDTVQIDHYFTDTIYSTECRDTTHVLVTWDAYDSTNYKTFFDNFFEVEYMTLPNGQKYRFKAKIEKHWYKEQWDDLLQQWK